MSYKQDAEAYKAKAQESLGDQFKVVTDDMDRVRSSGVLDHALKVNDSAPDFSLPDACRLGLSIRCTWTHNLGASRALRRQLDSNPDDFGLVEQRRLPCRYPEPPRRERLKPLRTSGGRP
jgi:hypothetical protein